MEKLTIVEPSYQENTAEEEAGTVIPFAEILYLYWSFLSFRSVPVTVPVSVLVVAVLVLVLAIIDFTR